MLQNFINLVFCGGFGLFWGGGVFSFWFFVGCVLVFFWFYNAAPKAVHTKLFCDHTEIDNFFSYFSLDGKRSLKAVVLGDVTSNTL